MAWQAAQPTPVQSIPDDALIAQAMINGASVFQEIGCAVCHVYLLKAGGFSATRRMLVVK